MIKPITIVSAGRQGRNIVQILENGTTGPVAGFLDDTKPVGETIVGHPELDPACAIPVR
jgi:hypothetical protein